ncbi:hypothetical protein JCM19239_5142 [Vibrio variabilis]|uniref:Lipoprotein n=1 Tax=Vibrio variabilis TaxID=990271 RepID=A0ABQ0J974_9VIBR|nr:hypothetical protein JCM19239_5142 [Vibrio variabilis]
MKLKTLSTLIAVALTAGTLSGCNFYDELLVVKLQKSQVAAIHRLKVLMLLLKTLLSSLLQLLRRKRAKSLALKKAVTMPQWGQWFLKSLSR